MYFKKMFLLTLVISYSQFTLAVPQEKLPAEIAGEEGMYYVANINYAGWTSGATTETSLNPIPTNRPKVDFRFISAAFTENKVNRGSYCNSMTIGGLWSAKRAKAVQDALAYSKKVFVDSKDFKTSFSQSSHNDAVPEIQETYLRQFSRGGRGSAEHDKCYWYNIDVSKIMIINAEGEKVSLEEEAKKNKKYEDADDVEAKLKTLRHDLEAAEKEAQSARDSLEMTAGKVLREKAKTRVQETDAKVKELEKAIGKLAPRSNTAPPVQSGTAR